MSEQPPEYGTVEWYKQRDARSAATTKEAYNLLTEDVHKQKAEIADLHQAFEKRHKALREMAELLGVEIGGGPRDLGVSSYDLPERLVAAVADLRRQLETAQQHWEEAETQVATYEQAAETPFGECFSLPNGDCIGRGCMHDGDVADLKLSLSEVLTALDGREPEGGIYTSQAAQRVADLKGQLEEQAKTFLAMQKTSEKQWRKELGELALERDKWEASARREHSQLEQVTQELDSAKDSLSEWVNRNLTLRQDMLALQEERDERLEFGQKWVSEERFLEVTQDRDAAEGAAHANATWIGHYRTHAKALAEALEAVVEYAVALEKASAPWFITRKRAKRPDATPARQKWEAALTAWQEFEKGEAK